VRIVQIFIEHLVRRTDGRDVTAVAILLLRGLFTTPNSVATIDSCWVRSVVKCRRWIVSSTRVTIHWQTRYLAAVVFLYITSLVLSSCTRSLTTKRWQVRACLDDRCTMADVSACGLESCSSSICLRMTYHCCLTSSVPDGNSGVVSIGVGYINEVALRQARLVLGWVIDLRSSTYNSYIVNFYGLC